MRSGRVPAIFLAILAGCAGRTAAPAAASRAGGGLAEEIVAASDRTERDRSMDAHRKPVAMLAFFEVARPALQKTKHFLRQWDDPLPPEATELDAVYSVAVYGVIVPPACGELAGS